jgi:hypothetical protein
MASIGDTTRPEYIYDQATDTWIPVGIGPHSHTPAAIGAISSSVVTTKGDLIVGTGSGTVVRQGVGADGSYLVADSTQADGLNYAGPSYIAGKNFLINGGFDIWQRGTSFVQSSNTAYTADRFVSTSTNQMTISRQTTGVPAGSQYCLRMASGFTNSVSDFFQYIETANVVPLQGKTVTYSIKMRRNATNTSDSIILIQKSSTTDAGGGASWSTISSATIANSLLPTGTGVADWYTASLTLTIPNDGTANSLRVYASTSAQIPNAAYLELAQLQLEVGSVATPFSRAGGTIQGELAACQRYYWRTTTVGSQKIISQTVYSGASTFVSGFWANPVTMRIAATSLDSANLIFQSYTGTQFTMSAVTLDAVAENISSIYASVTGATAGQVGRILTSTSLTSYIGFSAEL